MDINLTQGRGAGVHESVRRARGNDNNAARLYLARLISHRDRGRAFDGECDSTYGCVCKGGPCPGLAVTM